MGGAYGTNEAGGEILAGSCWGNLEERVGWKDPGVDGKKIRKGS